MGTLIYAPGIRVHVETVKGILDITEDITNWQLVLRENAVHTFSFRLQNAQRKYDGLLLPMDRISVQLKRLRWLQNFSGYLNDGPIFQAWPGELNITASCTLKIPQFWPWDPTTTAASTMMQAVLGSSNGPSSVNSTAGDNNLSKLVVESLAQVTKWDRKKIHIGQVPGNWFKFAAKVGALIQRDTDMSAIIGSTSIAGGSPGSWRVNIPAGSYGGQSLNAVQAKNASAIYNTTIYTVKMTTRDAVMAIQCSMQEASLLNLANSNNPASLAIPHDGVGSDHGSVGLFQQQVGGAPNSTANWGTVQELMNTVTSTEKFLVKLKQVEGTGVGSGIANTNGMLIQKVQGSAFPSAYDKWQTFAEAVVNKANAISKSGIPAGDSTGLGSTIGNLQPQQSSGAQVAKMAYDLIKDHLPPSQPIVYSGSESGYKDDLPDVPKHNVKSLDCSSLVAWCYYQATGNFLQPKGQHFSDAQYNLCPIKISVDLARYVQGSLLVIRGDHVGISLGNNQHVAAHMRYPDPRKDCTVSSIDSGGGFNAAGLLPGVDYSQAATTQAAADQLKRLGVKNAKVGPNFFGVTDPSQTAASPTSPFSSLINALTFQASDFNSLGNILGGHRALINDQPFLGWLQNVVNASMRSFCSAPNGDFIAWFPDYFGFWGTAGIMNIEPIELQDFSVMWSDQQMVTHQFLIGSPGATSFDQSSAGVSTFDPLSQISQSSLFVGTSGIATMDYPEIFQAIYGKSATPAWTAAFLKRFGARPDVQTMPMIKQGAPEFFMALYLFMRRWAGMFSATVPMTFMPELWPGQLMRIKAFGFQAYVTGVTHSGQYGAQGSFTTSVEICAPANIDKASRADMLALLPQGGRPLA